MLRFVFVATLLVTLAVNIIFLFATKDKPPDLAPATSTLISVMASGRSVSLADTALRPTSAAAAALAVEPDDSIRSFNPATRRSPERRLFLRSNDFYDYSSPPPAPTATEATEATARTPANGSTNERQPPEQEQEQDDDEVPHVVAPMELQTTNRKQVDDEQNKQIIIKPKAYQVDSSDNSIDLDKTNKHQRRQKHQMNSETSAGATDDDNYPKSARKSLSIRVKSSKNHVFISVDGNVIYESKPTRSNLVLSSSSSSSTLASRRRRRAAARKQANRLTKRQSSAEEAPQPPTKSIAISIGGGGGLQTTTANTTTAEGYDGDGDGDDELSGAPDELARGIHVVVLNQFDGHVMSRRLFDTYSAWQDDELCLYLRQVQDGRLLVLAVRDEASFKMAPNSQARLLLQQLGSRLISQLQWRDMWALVLRKRSPPETAEQLAVPESSVRWSVQHQNRVEMNLAEGLAKSRHFSEWAPPVELQVDVKLLDERTSTAGCNWKRKGLQFDENDDEYERRSRFCSRVEGYGRVCDCKYPSEISFNTTNDSTHLEALKQVPIIVIASNRPYYLFRMLKGLLQADGVDPNMVTVFIDGYYDEPLAVTQLFKLRAVQQRPLVSQRPDAPLPGSVRISHHYKTSLAATFNLFPEAQFAIILEEDLDVSRDILVYFNQTLEVLSGDPSLYCVSAWNDQGYEHSSGRDPQLVYRIETMPGLGWMLSRRLYKEELEARWPSAEQPHDWDMWIRTGQVRRGRECLIPDISRTFHFGSTGTNINAYFQRQYFNKHNFYLSKAHSPSSIRFNTSQLYAANYEQLMETIIAEANVIRPPVELQATNTTQQLEYLCSMANIPGPSESESESESGDNKANVIFIEMIEASDFRNWLKLAKCWRLWDLDARGQHKSTWRLYLKGRPLLVVGVPAAPYSHLMPADLMPFKL